MFNFKFKDLNVLKISKPKRLVNANKKNMSEIKAPNDTFESFINKINSTNNPSDLSKVNVCDNIINQEQPEQPVVKPEQPAVKHEQPEVKPEQPEQPVVKQTHNNEPTSSINNEILLDYINNDYDVYKNEYIFEHVYIISLKKCLNKRERCINQLLKYNISNYEFFDAVDTINTNFYNILYEQVISNYSKEFIQNNYRKGALGCLLSHLNILKDAKQKGYKSILILEDDFLIRNEFQNSYRDVVKNIPSNWDYIYFGKKQGNKSKIPKDLNHIYPSKLFDITKINDYVYKPNYFTYATHSICIKNTIYDALIDRYNTLCAPVDLIVMSLYEKHNFYVLYDDLFITSFESDIRETTAEKELLLWKWDLSHYFSSKKLCIKNIIIWGFEKINHTHHYIHNMYYRFFKYYFGNVNVLWCSNDEIQNNCYDNSLFFVSPTHGHYSNLPLNNSSLYIFHLDDFSDNNGINIDTFNSIEAFRKIIAHNRGIILLAREKITNLKYFEKNLLNNTICLPWFSNIMFNDIIKIKLNIDNIYQRNIKGKNFCYFGTTWYLNVNEVLDLTTSSIKNNNRIVISGRFLKNSINMINTIRSGLLTIEQFYEAKKDTLPVEQDNFDRLNNKYGISAFFPIQGAEHNNTYISNRLLEVISNGYVGFSNNILVNRLFKNVYYNSNISELIKYISNLLNSKDEYCQVLDKQLDEIIVSYYGYKIIDNLLYFLQKIVLKNYIYFSFNSYIDGKSYNLFFTNRIFKNYHVINTIDLLEQANTIKNNYIISENLYDVFMLDKIIKYKYYNILIDDDYKYKELLINLCVKHKKAYTIKHPLKVYCLFSHQRTGSTLIIDYIQKTSKKVLALSEIFSENNDYSRNSYDVHNPNGVLYNNEVFELNTDASNLKEYMCQFIDIAEEKGYEALVFKYTFDVINKFDTTNIEELINKFKNYHIIYLDRNDIDIYISKKLADKNNTYSNKIYGTILGKDDFNIDQFTLYLRKKNQFLNDFLSKLNNIKYINYNFIKENDHEHNITYINNLLNSFYSTKIKYLKYEKYYDYYNIFNKKQNKFDNTQFISNILEDNHETLIEKSEQGVCKKISRGKTQKIKKKIRK
jgi:hypothetical protein